MKTKNSNERSRAWKVKLPKPVKQQQIASNSLVKWTAFCENLNHGKTNVKCKQMTMMSQMLACKLLLMMLKVKQIGNSKP